ncbi:hypothetical protein DERP_010673 [Dermatophagoides pteronyssinus]|uniref:Uncharacterized protein n=1 Tax=Dermatophagoides pteronyssinus TaxID=6956 RepID=A0ABQ8JA28_DERPT|nr:hypothetical protein DERP_010673 [Dermatophagoides pteronyssinus]
MCHSSKFLFFISYWILLFSSQTKQKIGKNNNNNSSLFKLVQILKQALLIWDIYQKQNDKNQPFNFIYGTSALEQKWNKKDDDSILIIIFGDVSVSLEQNE